MPLDLNNIKEQLQTILQTANTTTASTDLSSGLESRVQRILKVNPNRIPIQADWYPFVSVFIDRKEMLPGEFGAQREHVHRRANVSLKVVGGVFNSTITDEEVDPADEDCEDLMSNIEKIVRANPRIGGSVDWAYSRGVTFHNLTSDEGVHVRVGVMDISATTFYQESAPS
jgi:hypothetical protein